MHHVTDLSAVLAATLFTGAALYITFVEHPARLHCGTILAATVFGPSYKRATVMQVSLVVLATGSGLASWLRTGAVSWLIGAVLIAAVVPFTLLAIMPTNKRLLEPDLDRAAPSTRQLLVFWGRLHSVRSVLGLVASAFFLWSALTP